MSLRSPSSLDIWMMLTVSLSQEELEKAAFIKKFIWTKRNSLIHQNDFSHPNSIMSRAKEEFQQLKMFQITQSRTLRTQNPPTQSVKWQRPSSGFLKPNWDVSCDSKSRKIGIGAIFRNSEDKVIDSVQASRNIITNLVIVEAYAI